MYNGFGQPGGYQPNQYGFQGGIGTGGFGFQSEMGQQGMPYQAGMSQPGQMGFQGGIPQPGYGSQGFQSGMGGFPGGMNMGGYNPQPSYPPQTGYQQQNTFPQAPYQPQPQFPQAQPPYQTQNSYQHTHSYQPQPSYPQQQPIAPINPIYQHQSTLPPQPIQPQPLNHTYTQAPSFNQTVPLPQMGSGVPMESPNYNPEHDCDLLRKAMKGLGTDEDTIIKLVCNRTSHQRQEIKKYYATAYGKDLIKQLKSELSGKLEDVVIGLFQSPAEFDATCLYKAMKGLGTDEDTLIEIIGTRVNWQIQQIKAAFNALYKKDLIKWVESETSGCFRKLLVSLLQGNRSENQNPDPAMCSNDAQALYRAGAGRWGTDEAMFNKIFALRSAAEIRMISQYYEQQTGKTLLKAVDSEFSGDIKKLLYTVVQGLLNPSEYFATRVRKAVKGLGTNDKTLIRVLISRDEVDMPQIKAEYQRLYGRNMMGDIRSDTSGDYRKILNELAGH